MKKYFSILCASLLLFCAINISCSDGNGNSNSSENSNDSGNSSTEDSYSHLFEYVGNKDYRSPKNVEITSAAAQNQSEGLKDSWWRETNFYHIWVKSFADSDDDGCGDFKGIEDKLSYIKDDLGCDGIWLSPIFECDYKRKDENFNMHGYDVKDYYAVNNYFGKEDDLISLINACHKKGIKIIFDFVPNHSSSENQWFKDSCNNENGKKDWYVWNDTQLNWNTGMGLSGWTYNAALKQYYWHAFAETQPDLNFRNWEVREEMKNVVRYWLNKGFDGLRVDAVRYLVEEEDLQCDTDETHKWFQELRSEIDKYAKNGLSPKFMACEAWITNDRTRLEKYFGTETNPEFNMVFDFDQGSGLYESITDHNDTKLRSLKTNPNENQTYGTFIANHDDYLNRIGTLCSDSQPFMKLLTAMSLLRPTTPFIYYGNEIGMKDNPVLGDGDIRHRGNFNWTEAENQKTDSSSLFNMNKALLSIRNEYNLANGNLKFLESTQNSVSAYTISDGTNTILCVFNLSFEAAKESSFTKPSDLDISKYSVLVGINTEKTLSESEGSLKIANLSPCEACVYLLGDDSKTSVFTYSITEEEITKMKTDEETIETLYLRGDFNGWGTNYEMVYDPDSKTFGFGVKVSKMGIYQFKFDQDGNWRTAYGSGENNPNGKMVFLNQRVNTSTKTGESTNFAFNATSTTDWYTFIFYTEDKTFEIVTRYSYDD